MENPEPTPGFQGVWIPAALWNHPELSWMEKCLAAEIDSLSKNASPCFASSERLAKNMKTTSTAVLKMLSELMAKNVVWQIGFDGRTAWRCLNPLYSCNQEKYRIWMQDVRYEPKLKSALTSSSEQLFPPAHTEIPIEIPIEKNIRIANRQADQPRANEGEEDLKMKKTSTGQQLFNEVERAVDAFAEDRKLPTGMPILSVLKTYINKLGFPDSDAESVYDAWLASEFRDGHNRKIRDWHASIRNKARNGWLPSQKNKPVQTKDREAEKLARIRELARRSKQ